MSTIRPETASAGSVDDVIVTQMLGLRPARLPNLAAEHSSFVSLARELVGKPEDLLQRLCEAAVELCGAGSAGVSLLERAGDEEQFRWVAMAGTYAPYVGGTTPRNFSPCGTCLDRGSAQLYYYPERYFTYFSQVEPPIVEGLVVPFSTSSRVLGTIWIVSHSEAERGFDNEDVRIMSSLADFTAAALEQMQLRREAQAAEQYFRGLFEFTGDAILVTNEEGQYLDANVAAEELLGYGSDELKTMSVPQVVSADTQWTESEFKQFRQDGHWRGELDLVRKDGTVVPVEAQATTVELTTGRVFASVIRDISERKGLERLQKEFLAAVGHELRSPLTPIIGFAQIMLRRGEFDSDATEEIVAQSRRLLRLISDILDASSFEAGKLELHRKEIDVRPLVERVAENVRILARSHKVMVELPLEPVVGQWDADRLEQVLQNLLSNAIKYSPHGGDVLVHVANYGAEVEFSVKDQGIGISPDEMPKLFSRFQRTAAARNTTASGVGLGLFVAKFLVEAHGGRIWVESGGPGRGSCFAFRLPSIYTGA